MCTSKRGIYRLKEYFGIEDPPLYEPLFFAQYLLVPVNTIVKNYLLPWMMKDYSTLLPTSNKFLSRKAKSEVFLRYTLLTDLMTIAETHKRNQFYNFANDKKLTKLLNREYGLSGQTKKIEVTIAFDNFLTIWLCTLPEKFKQWYKFHKSGNKQGYKSEIDMDMGQILTSQICKSF